MLMLRNIIFKEDFDAIVFSGGATKRERYSEALAMRNYMYNNVNNKFSGTIILETESKTTWGNAENTKSILGEYVHSKIRLLTVGYHLKRATNIFTREGFSNLVPLASEDYISPELFGEYKRYLKSTRGIFEQTKEFLIRGITLAEPKGKILERIADKTRR